LIHFYKRGPDGRLPCQDGLREEGEGAMGKKGSSGGGCTFRIRSPILREFLAEFLGTFVLVTFGCASIAQSVLSLQNKGDFFSINWGWALGLMLGLLVSGGVSGGHLNPAVSVAVATIGKFPWWKVPHYLAAQYLGAFVASATVFLVYWDALVWYEHDRGAYRSIPDTAGIFGTFPSDHLSYAGGIGDQFLATGLLVLCVCAITDRRNMQVTKQLVPLYIGLTVLAIGICFGFNCGFALNPARDFAPRLFSMLAGWGPGVFSYYHHWWIVPVIATHAGAVAGAWIYYLAIEINWPPEDYDPEDDEVAKVYTNGGKAPTFTPAYQKTGPSPQKHGYYPEAGFDDRPQSGLSRGSGAHTPDDVKYRPLPAKAAFQDELDKKIHK